MTSLLKRNLNQMVDFADANKVISACIGREDVCRFLLHSFMDYMTDHGLYDSSFEVLIDWSRQLNVHIDDKRWKVKKPDNISKNIGYVNHNSNHSNDSNQSNHVHHKKKKSSQKKKKRRGSKVIKKFNDNHPSLTPSNSVPVTPIDNHNKEKKSS